MPAAYTTLSIGGVSLVDNTNYSLTEAGWAPAVAPRRRSALTNRSPYEDVVEEIVINVYGTTATVALDNLQVLSALLDRAEAWAAGQNVLPVLLEVQPQGSNLSAALSAAVLGRAGSSALLDLPVTFNDKLMIYTIENVTLRFLRRGQWLAAAATSTGTAADAPGPMSVSLGTLPLSRIPAALKVSVKGLQELPSGAIPASTILVGRTNRLIVIEGEAMTGTSWASVADSGNLARGGSVGRFSPASTATVQVTGAITMEAGRVGIWAAVRNNGAPNYTVQAELRTSAGLSNGLARPVYVAGGVTTPQIVYLGSVATPYASAFVRLYLTPSSSGATFDVDYLVLLNMESDASAVVETDAAATGATVADLFIDHRALTKPTPAVYYTPDGIGNDTFPIGARGRLWLADDPAEQNYVMYWLATSGTAWRPNNGAGTVATAALEIARRPAYLVPQ